MKHIHINYLISPVDDQIHINLKLLSPEQFTFEDDFELSVLLELSETLNEPLPKLLIAEILRELEELNAHVSYEAEIELKDSTEEWFSNLEFVSDEVND